MVILDNDVAVIIYENTWVCILIKMSLKSYAHIKTNSEPV